MTRLHLEFLVEPFVAGAPGPHVDAAIDAAGTAGLSVESGPFANVAAGDVDDVAIAVGSLLRDAFAHGASRVSVVAELADESSDGLAAVGAGTDGHGADPSPTARPSDAEAFLAAVAPLVDALGASVVRGADDRRPGDLDLRWRGTVVGVVRPTPLTEALDHLMARVEHDLGGSLASLDRADKQRAVALLHERGAFALRRSTDAVAEAMGVSRITIYNYLNALETTADPA